MGEDQLAERPFTFLVCKRLFDIGFAASAILLLLPLFFVIAFLVKVGDGGQVLYRGTRSGLGGKNFSILKFRTMIEGAELGAGTTSKDDPRVTAIGSFLRKTKLDELPQFFNVLIGEMSIVGPRPELPRYTSLYVGPEQKILSVRPGITDYSSIEFSNLSELIDDEDPDGSFERRILVRKNELRVKYVQEMSFMTDLKIILKTFMKVVAQLT